jgi:chromate transporter
MTDTPVRSPKAQPGYSPRELLGYFFRLGALGFGGPVALVGSGTHGVGGRRDLVEWRHWIGEEAYNEGLALSQLSPGPLAAQLAMYL